MRGHGRRPGGALQPASRPFPCHEISPGMVFWPDFACRAVGDSRFTWEILPRPMRRPHSDVMNHRLLRRATIRSPRVKFNNNNVLDRLLRVAVVKTATPAYAVAEK